MQRSRKILLITTVTIVVLVACFPRETRDRSQWLIEKPSAVMMDEFNQQETGIYYFNFPSCPWCTEVTPLLENVLLNEFISAYTINIHSNDFQNIQRSVLLDFIRSKSGQSEIEVPLIVMISQDGDCQVQLGTVNGHDATKTKLTIEQKQFLIVKLHSMIERFQRHNRAAN